MVKDCRERKCSLRVRKKLPQLLKSYVLIGRVAVYRMVHFDEDISDQVNAFGSKLSNAIITPGFSRNVPAFGNMSEFRIVFRLPWLRRRWWSRRIQNGIVGSIGCSPGADETKRMTRPRLIGAAREYGAVSNEPRILADGS